MELLNYPFGVGYRINVIAGVGVFVGIDDGTTDDVSIFVGAGVLVAVGVTCL
jgi:hypothetical protein